MIDISHCPGLCINNNKNVSRVNYKVEIIRVYRYEIRKEQCATGANGAMEDSGNK